MRVTRWVVAGKIVHIDENPTVPTTITVEILKSRFHEQGDVNNLVGNPGDPVDVSITEETKLRRRYFGKAVIAEFSEGDTVQVIGRRNETAGTIDAQFVRDDSIQKLGVSHHVSTVQSIDTATNTILAVPLQSDAVWTVKVSAATKIMKGGDEITLADIAAGDKIRVGGIANRKTKVIQANYVNVIVADKEQVKDRLKEIKRLKGKVEMIEKKGGAVEDVEEEASIPEKFRHGKVLKELRDKLRAFKGERKKKSSSGSSNTGGGTLPDAAATGASTY